MTAAVELPLTSANVASHFSHVNPLFTPVP